MQAPIRVFPAQVDLRAKESPVVDQGDIGSCTGNALASALEYLELLEINSAVGGPEIFHTGQFSRVSRLFIYYNERVLEGDTGIDAGAAISEGIKSIQTQGVCRECTWPYLDANALIQPSAEAFHEALVHRELRDYRIDLNLNAMKQCLVFGYPFVFGITVYDSFLGEHAAQTGVIPMPAKDESVQGGHALLCVGYDDATQVFIFKNSWSTSWGDKGYGYLPYAYMTNSDLTADLWTLRNIEE